MNVELAVISEKGTKVHYPVVEEGIEWSTERRSSPGKLTFNVVNDNGVELLEGNTVELRVDGTPVFFGFIFSKKRSREGTVTITAYDQLRYLKNKDIYVYENKTASQLVKMIADDFSLKVGELEDTGYLIASRVEDNTSLIDMIENALDLTLTNTKEMFVLYDDFGYLALKSIGNMYVGEPGAYLLIDEETGENFEYNSSIDTNTYNKIKLIYDDEDTGKRDVYTAKDAEKILEWGILQYFDKVSKGENGQAKADALLQLYNKKTRNLKITNALGDVRVRAGSMVVVSLDLGDVRVNNFMLVEKCSHKFKLNEHLMDLTLRGGDFVG